MTVLREPDVKWNPDQMVEVTLNEPDDFLKVRETLTRIGVASGREKIYQSAIFFISKVDIFSTLQRIFALMVTC